MPFGRIVRTLLLLSGTAACATPSAVAPATASPNTAAAAWTGTMDSSSNYTVTAPLTGGLVCGATWSTSLAFDVSADSHVSGIATSTIVGTPVCIRPEYQTTSTVSITSTITGRVSTTQLTLQFAPLSYVP